MRPIWMIVALLVTPLAPSVAETPGAAADAGAEGEAWFLTRVRQLTYEGRRAGEGYFSPDGLRMVFQSERDPTNPFFQIYTLDLETGDTKRVSNGVGKTTCPFIQPGSGHVLYASTHHDPASARLQREELEFRASGQERRYDWDFDPQMDLYVSDGGGSSTRLTEAIGYDAEGSYSPDGKWIVFSSTRSAFERELDTDEERRLEIDPAYFSEIYVMGADGNDPRRLTETAGYDGGPFFTPDGKRIVWRRFDTDGLIADVWTMNRDGSDARPITDFGSMSWAPYPHPTGEYVFFTSNKYGFGNFEVFIVDIEGRREPVRVTTTDGFDGLPVPTPDGRRLTWTSTRRGGEGGQIMIGEWNHDRALEALRSSPERRIPADEGD